MAREGVMLARYAEALFWMARYLERVENLARLIDVTQGFESPGHEAESWHALVRINADEENFAALGHVPGADAVKAFYLADRANPTSIPAALEAARFNARTLRPLISTEMWRQLNMFHRAMAAIPPTDMQGDRLARLCTRIKEGVQAHTGITEGTLFRDQGWIFYRLGRLIERADQTTRLLDIRYHLLVGPSEREERRVAELARWGGVLRAAAGFHAFQRVAKPGFTPADVVAFLLLDPGFPRSVALCVREMRGALDELAGRWGLRQAGQALALARTLDQALRARPVAAMIEGGLHEVLDTVQRDLIALAAEIGTAFFRDWRLRARG